MKRKVLLGATALIGGVMIAAGAMATAASADTLYSNGPVNGTINAYTIGYYDTYAVTDSFTAAAGSTVTSADFGVWVEAGVTLTSVDWTITSGNPLDGSSFTVLGSGTVDPTLTGTFLNADGYDVSEATFSTGSVSLSGGDYYLELSNSMTDTTGFPYDTAFWDEAANGQSTAYQSGVGPIASESFDIYGTTGSGSGAPEPGTWALMMLGVGGIGLAFRQAKKKHGFSFAGA